MGYSVRSGGREAFPDGVRQPRSDHRAASRGALRRQGAIPDAGRGRWPARAGSGLVRDCGRMRPPRARSCRRRIGVERRVPEAVRRAVVGRPLQRQHPRSLSQLPRRDPAGRHDRRADPALHRRARSGGVAVGAALRSIPRRVPGDLHRNAADAVHQPAGADPQSADDPAGESAGRDPGGVGSGRSARAGQHRACPARSRRRGRAHVSRRARDPIGHPTGARRRPVSRLPLHRARRVRAGGGPARHQP